MNAEIVAAPAAKFHGVPVAAGPPCHDGAGAVTGDPHTQLIVDPRAKAPRRRGPKPKSVGPALDEAFRRRRAGETIRTIAAALETPRSTVGRALRRAGVRRPARSSIGARTPRQKLYAQIKRGQIPDANVLACVDCRHRRTEGQPRHEWALSAKPEGGWKISPVCIKCHRRRKRMVRVAAYRALVDTARRNMGRDYSPLPAGTS